MNPKSAKTAVETGRERYNIPILIHDGDVARVTFVIGVAGKID